MEPFQFLRGLLAWMVTVTILWPINIPLLALAYKVRQGPTPIGLERQEFWLRCAGGAFVVALATLVGVWLDNWLVAAAELPPGPTHLIVLAVLSVAAVWILFVFLALEDMTQGLSVFLLYVFLPMFVLFLVNLIVGLWNPLLDSAYLYLK